MRIPTLTLLMLAAMAAPAQADRHALLDNSPALGAAADCGNADQRGAARLQARCDSGAFESPLNSPAPAPQPKPVTGEGPIAQTPDTTRPRLRVRGVPKTVTRKAFNAGLKVRVSADEPIAAEISLLAGSPRRLLAARSLALAPGARTVTLKAKSKLTGSRAIRARVRVVAIDGSANPSAKTITFRVR